MKRIWDYARMLNAHAHDSQGEYDGRGGGYAGLVPCCEASGNFNTS